MKNSINPRYRRSVEMLERATKVIPLGSQTFSKSYIQFPHGHAPLFIKSGKGARCWDVDGNEYVDLVNGLLPVVLGYCDPDVDAAIVRQLREGTVFSMASELEIDLAERLVELIPCAEAVRYGKNGSDATSGAIRLARAYTRRDRVAIGGYHGWQDWYIGATSRNKGVPVAVAALSHRFAFGDAAALDAVLRAHPGEFAAVILEPVSSSEPKAEYLAEVKEIAHRHGALLIFDEIVTGFRIHLGGAQAHYGVTPDLSAFGKSMANGLAISAVVGRADIMLQMEEIFFSSTFGGEALALAASIAVIDKMKRQPVIDTLWRRGRQLREAVEAKIAANGLGGQIATSGADPWVLLSFKPHKNPKSGEQTPGLVIKTMFQKEMLARGVMINASHNVSYALTDADIAHVLSAYDAVLKIIAAELDRGQVEQRLECPIVKPVFAVR
jgi:glutamate-1-semialdehyde aminotransferase